MYDYYEELLKRHGCKSADVAKATGIHPSTFTDWKKGKSAPKADKLQKIADYFGVSVDYLMTGNENGYYFNEETARKAQEVFKNPQLHALFDIAQDSTPQDIQLAIDMLIRLKATNKDG